MYIQRVGIKNIRSLVDLEWKVDKGFEAGWHVILGDNSAGKSTFLRAIAFALLGAIEAEALRQNWEQWLTRGETMGGVEIEVSHDILLDPSNPLPASAPTTSDSLPRVSVFANKSGDPPLEPGHIRAGCEILRQGDSTIVRGLVTSQPQSIDVRMWDSKRGWFSASFGPFRRFSGGDAEFASLSQSRPRLAAHLSLFGENFALTEALRWLQELDYRRKDQKPEGKLLDDLIRFVNESELLPHETRLRDVSSDGVVFEDGNGCEVPVLELSDGYRSILSLTFELIRQMSIRYGPETVFDPATPGQINLPGVVLIDEVDVHLHPTWQHRIGNWFLQYFPNIQFIVTTHSPIVCQAAVKGSVWRLPVPGSEEQARRLEGAELDRLLYGNLLDAYGTGVFGVGVTRSEAGKERVRRLAELNVKSLESDLTEEEKQQQSELRESTPTAGSVLLEDAEAENVVA